MVGKLYKKERRVDGLAQAVGSGSGPGTLSPPVNGFCPWLLATTSVQKMVLQCVFIKWAFVFLCVQEIVFVCVCVYLGCVRACFCGPKLSFTKKKKKICAHHWSFVPSFRCLFLGGEKEDGQRTFQNKENCAKFKNISFFLYIVYKSLQTHQLNSKRGMCFYF